MRPRRLRRQAPTDNCAWWHAWQAHYRGAKAALALRQYAGCDELCRAGLEVEPGNKELQSLAQRAAAAEAEAAARKEAEQCEWRAKRGPALLLAQAILKRGWKVGRPQFRLGTAAAGRGRPWQLSPHSLAACHALVLLYLALPALGRRVPACRLPHAGEQKPYLDEQGLVHWPVLFFYPEAAMRQDIVQDFCEADSFRRAPQTLRRAAFSLLGHPLIWYRAARRGTHAMSAAALPAGTTWT